MSTVSARLSAEGRGCRVRTRVDAVHGPAGLVPVGCGSGDLGGQAGAVTFPVNHRPVPMTGPEHPGAARWRPISCQPGTGKFSVGRQVAGSGVDGGLRDRGGAGSRN